MSKLQWILLRLILLIIIVRGVLGFFWLGKMNSATHKWDHSYLSSESRDSRMLSSL